MFGDWFSDLVGGALPKKAPAYAIEKDHRARYEDTQAYRDGLGTSINDIEVSEVAPLPSSGIATGGDENDPSNFVINPNGAKSSIFGDFFNFGGNDTKKPLTGNPTNSNNKNVGGSEKDSGEGGFFSGIFDGFGGKNGIVNQTLKYKVAEELGLTPKDRNTKTTLVKTQNKIDKNSSSDKNSFLTTDNLVLGLGVILVIGIFGYFIKR